MNENMFCRRARERMRLISPDTAAKVLTHDRYWTTQFLELYLERCDALNLEDPKAGYKLGVHAPGLADRIRVSGKPGEYRTEAEHRSHLVLAFAYMGSCCRRVVPTEAKLAFARAQELALAGCSRIAAAELSKRYAAYLGQALDPRAERWADRAIELYEVGDPGLAAALVLRGSIRFSRQESGIGDSVQALRLADRKTPRGSWVLLAALNNIAHELTFRRAHMADVEQALSVIRRLRRARHKSLARTKLLWTEARLSSLVGLDAYAERTLLKAREGLREVGDLFEYALISLDLASLYREWNDRELFTRLVQETEATLRQAVEGEQLLTQLAPWRRRLPTQEELRELRMQVTSAGVLA